MGSQATDLRDFLQGANGIDTSNLNFSFTPSEDVVIADYEEGPTYPEASIVSKDPAVQGGGDTRFTGYDPSGAGPIQEVVTSLQVDCWGGEEGGGLDVHPGQAAEELGTEIHRACFEAAAAKAPADYEWISANEPFENHDTKDDPPAYRETTICFLKSRNTP